MKFTTPNPRQVFTISAEPTWPSVVFKTDAAGAHTWHWTVAWGSFSQAGKETTPSNSWDAKAAIANYGGTLTVRAVSGQQSATIAVLLHGTNPTAAAVTHYLAAKADSAGFEKIINHESHFRHFNKHGEPIKSFDHGYGMCQLTKPAPSFAQVWSWKLNVDGGLALFNHKRTEAIHFLGQHHRSFTNEQVKYEAVSRWNGGSYHEWDASAGRWVRKHNILCDTKTGNIGWDTNVAENQGKTEEELHQRDKGKYGKAPHAGDHWKYYGVCYADRVLGS